MDSTTGFLSALQQGGIMMIFLGLASLMALAVIVEKLWNLRRALVAPEPAKQILMSMLETGAVERAHEYCQENRLPLTRLVDATLSARGLGRDDMRELVLDQGRQETAALERYLPLLGTIAAVSPLMGLMGTVLGMMDTFKVIAQIGPGQSDALSAGIAQALITTVTGLAIAVPALVFHNAFHARVGRYILEMETYTLRILKVLRAQAKRDVIQAASGVEGSSEPAAGD